MRVFRRRIRVLRRPLGTANLALLNQIPQHGGTLHCEVARLLECNIVLTNLAAPGNGYGLPLDHRFSYCGQPECRDAHSTDLRTLSCLCRLTRSRSNLHWLSPLPTPVGYSQARSLPLSGSDIQSQMTGTADVFRYALPV